MCSVCNDIYGGCPCCQEDAETEECESCSGQGYQYFDTENEIQVSKETYDKLPESQRSKEKCFECGGEGRIIK